MKSTQDWLDAYGESHQNLINKKIHWICVPLIMFSLIGLLWCIPMPGFLSFGGHFNWAWVLAIIAFTFYGFLNLKMFAGMFLIIGLMMFGNFHMANLENHLWVSICIFVFSWVMQFVGHKIEGKKPSFFKDLQFLLIGPLWVFYPLYKKLGIQV